MALKLRRKKYISQNGGGQRLCVDTPFRVAEAYKTMRTNIRFALAAAAGKAVVISSAMPAEGKSTTCANLAIAMAQTGERVMLLDADLRKPTQYQIFGLANAKGLSGLLAGFYSLDDVINREAEPNLDIITSGPLPPNPSELLGSDRMTELLRELCGQYSYIFLDTPPIGVVTDAVVLAAKNAGAMLVSRQGQTAYDSLSKAITALELAEVNILGLAINGMKDKAGKYGGYRYKYSNSGK